MKKSSGIDKNAFAREHRNAMRAMRFDFSGIGVPFSALSFVHWIIFFWMRQITPQTFSIMTQPMPPPMPIASVRLLSHP